MALQLTLSCDLDKKDSGPTLIHSTGVQHYKIPPEVVGKIESFKLREDGLDPSIYLMSRNDVF
jgi:hypothetical protein